MPIEKGKFGQAALPWHPMPYMDEYLDNLTVDLRSAEYIRTVRKGLARFAIFCRDEDLKHPEEIERRHLLRYQAFLNSMDFAPAYRQQLLKAVKAWLNWLVQCRYLTETPWYRIRVGSTPKKPKPLEDDDIATLFAAHRQTAFLIPPFTYHRREVILVLLYGWGLRIHELHLLNLSQMDMRLEWVPVRQKGGTTKTLPYSKAMKAVVNRWLHVRAKYGALGEDALLIDQQGKRLSIDMIRKIVTELGVRANIPVNPHRLRDTCGTNLLDDDVPVERVMKILGHTNQAQTLAYSRVSDPAVKRSHDESMDRRLDTLLFRRTS